MKVVIFFLFFLLLPFFINAQNSLPPLVVTIPKSGTHLIKLIIQSIIHKAPISPHLPPTGPKFVSYLNTQFSPKRNFLILHVESISDIKAYLTKYPNSKTILVIRNLRDVIVSAKDYITKYRLNILPYFQQFIESEFPGKITHRNWLSFKEKKKLMITMKYFFLFKEKNYRRFGLRHFVNDAIRFAKKYPNTLVIKFEDLLSENESFALNQIQTLANFLGKQLSESQLKQIKNRCFGNPRSHTYSKKKKLYRFKKEFDQKSAHLFYKYFGESEMIYNDFFNYHLPPFQTQLSQ